MKHRMKIELSRKSELVEKLEAKESFNIGELKFERVAAWQVTGPIGTGCEQTELYGDWSEGMEQYKGLVIAERIADKHLICQHGCSTPTKHEVVWPPAAVVWQEGTKRKTEKQENR